MNDFHTVIEWVRTYWVLGPFLPAAWKGGQWGWSLYKKWLETKQESERAKANREVERLLSEMVGQANVRVEDALHERDAARLELATVRATLDALRQQLEDHRNRLHHTEVHLAEANQKLARLPELETDNARLQGQVQILREELDRSYGRDCSNEQADHHHQEP